MVNKEEEDPTNEIKIVYLKKDDIPVIEILDKNKMIYDGKEYQISEYFNQIKEFINKIKDVNDNSIDLLDDNKYDKCGICKNNSNEYFCENCHKNICKNCYKNCTEEKHEILNLKEMEVEFKNIAIFIRINLPVYIIPIKEENIINENKPNIEEENIENYDILLIYDIISLDYNNYFHYQNVNNILSYYFHNYSNSLDRDYNFEGKGKRMFPDGGYYIGQFKNTLANGKGIQYNKNGNIIYEGDFVNDKAEGKGKWIYENGSYYIGQFKNNLTNGKGIEYDKNGNIRYEGDFVNGMKMYYKDD